MLSLESYNLDITHIRESNNVMVDYQSRNTRRESWEQKNNDVIQLASIWDNDEERQRFIEEMRIQIGDNSKIKFILNQEKHNEEWISVY